MEMFYTLQGEGFHTGRAAVFIRLAGCTVGCSWCDVKNSWDATAYPELKIESIVTEALTYPSRFAVITGGEPCMYNLRFLTTELKNTGFELALETSGAFPITGYFDWICVSPKKFKFPVKESLLQANELKCIIHNNSDFEWAEKNAESANPECRKFLQPEFSVFNKMNPLIVEYIKSHPQWRISLQTHKVMNIP
ncbi:MAG: 7-carboxy-7-deazaguanine synthase QueE [Bacteroidia bacterium]|nr:radical SAM protein [Bacteroidia bacterium]MCZ2277683.1 7-carboxy-7-deazaguanine synthase QueE [Bacteroidia bacterium]